MSRENTINLKNFYTNVIKKNPLLYSHQFIVTFDGADLPEKFKSQPENPFALTYYVKSTQVPQVTITEAKVNFLSQDFVVPKGVQYNGSWTTTLMMINKLYHYVALRDWIRYFSDLAKNGGGHKTIPNVTAHVHIIDSTMQEDLHDFVLEGVFPSNLPELPMQYENASTIPELGITFTYQYMYRADEGDPLKA